MRRYTDKELNAMSTEEWAALQKQALEEFEQLGQQLEDYLNKKSHPAIEAEGE